MSLEIKQGSVKFPAGKIFDNPYQPGETQQNIVCSMDDGTEEKLYFKTGRVPHAQLKKGDRIQIIFEVDHQGKRKRRLVAEVNGGSGHFVPAAGNVPVAPVYQQQAPQKQPASQPKKQSAHEFIQERLDIMHAVMKMVSASSKDLSEESVRTIATSILIEGSRKGIDFKEILVTQDQIVPEPLSTQPVENEVPF